MTCDRAIIEQESTYTTTVSKMVRLGKDSVKRVARHVRYDDIPTDTFTPRTYQVELLESALQGNTIACLGSGSSKVFLGLMVIRELSYQIRCLPKDGGKRSVYLAVSDQEVDSIWSTLYHHTDIQVGKALSSEAALWEQQDWSNFVNANSVLVMSASLFLHGLEKGNLLLTTLNLLVLDDCHVAVGDHEYVKIMLYVLKCGQMAPQLLCLTSSILGTECSDPSSLGSRISELESLLHSKAETSMLVISERFGCRPKESIIKCEPSVDDTGLTDQLATLLLTSWHFLDECQITLDETTGKRDPLHVPKFAISECLNILHVLGPWCAASIAENLLSQVEKITKHESNQVHKRFLRYVMTQLRLVVKVFEINFTPEYSVEELLKYTTSKLRALVDVLRKYKPEMDFMIISSEDADGDGISDMSDDDMNIEDDDDEGDDDDDDDSFDLDSSDEEDGRNKSPRHIHIAVKRKVETGSDNPFDDDRKLCALVFVDNRYVAFALNKMIEEVCSWDENLCFVKSSHITGQGIHRADGKKDLSKASRRQEEVLRKFRMQERNLLVSTNVLEEGVDIPKCNLVVRFDPPTDYRSYALSKGRARARDAEYVILVDEEVIPDFSRNLNVFKGIEEVLIGAGRGRQDLEDAQEMLQIDSLDFVALPPFSPSGEPGAPAVSMRNAIALVNRYCAKLPSDAFTHLTPQCRITTSELNPEQFVAHLRLPVNSPIKEEVMGSPMPSRQLAKMAVALKMYEMLYKSGELDAQLQPVGKEMFVCEEEEEEWEEGEDEPPGQARPGTTKRKQYYIKKAADAFVNSHPAPDVKCFVYHISMVLSGAITEEQNTRGRKIYAPEETSQSFGLVLSKQIPKVPSFPVYTRSGEVTVSVNLLQKSTYSQEQLDKLLKFHHFVFTSVLHLEKDPMMFSPQQADVGYIIVPLNTSEEVSDLDIEWSFVEHVINSSVHHKRNIFDSKRDTFQFDKTKFEDAVVMPSYRNIDQPQHFYVAEIRNDLSPLSPFPSPELYKTFAAYYTTKYGLTLTNMDQPLLDVDHTSARLNLLTPRYMNQKGRALPTSSVETKRARRENLQQKQILVPELCSIHVFPGSLWRKAVCLPAILYRTNYLLLAEELRKVIAGETGIGKVNLDPSFHFPRLDFGFETNPEKVQVAKQESEQEESTCSHTEDEAIELQQDIEKAVRPRQSTQESKLNQKVIRSVESVCAQEEEKGDDETSSDNDSGVTSGDSEIGGVEKGCVYVSGQCSEKKVISASLKDSFSQSSSSCSSTVNSDNEASSMFSALECKHIGDVANGKDGQCEPHSCKLCSPGKEGDKVLQHCCCCPLSSLCKTQVSQSFHVHITQNEETSSPDGDHGQHNYMSETFSDVSCSFRVGCELLVKDPNASLQNKCTKISDYEGQGDFASSQTNIKEKENSPEEPVLNHHCCEKTSRPYPDSGRKTISADIPNREPAAKSEEYRDKIKDTQSADYQCVEDCDDFLDVTGTNQQPPITSTFQVDPEISPFMSADKEIELTFESACNLDSIGLDTNWSKSNIASDKEWAPDESLTTFEVSETVSDLNPLGKNGVSESIFSNHRNHAHPENISQALPTETKERKYASPSSSRDSDIFGNDRQHFSELDLRSAEEPLFHDRDDLSESEAETNSSGQNYNKSEHLHKHTVHNMNKKSCSSSSVQNNHARNEGKNSTDFEIGVWNASELNSKPVSVKKIEKGPEEITMIPQKEGGAEEKRKTPVSLDADRDLETFVGPSPCLLLQALTMSNANDFFSLERLETIGDSFLKYAITVYLYCCYPGTHEGKLSYLRSKQVSNYNLYRLGRRKGLAERMVSTKFEPYENWLPPDFIISEDRRRGPVPKVVIATGNARLSATTPVNFVIEDEESETDTTQKREIDAFHQELKEIDRQQAADQQSDLSCNAKRAMIAYSLQLHHGIPDKSVADCVEALIGCYLTTCGKQAALTFMSWLGLKVLPHKRCSSQKEHRVPQEVNVYEFDELRCPPSPLIASVPDAPLILNRLLEGFSEFEAKIDYTFRDRSYLLQAFTHASYHYNFITDCYQRLEFLGDAILDYVITRHLYEDSQRYSPGILTDLRSALVNNNIFAALAVKWDFHKYFKAISPSLFAVIDKFVVWQKEREDQFDELNEEQEETDEEEENEEDKDEEVELEIPKALGDIFESVAGAIYLDSGMSLDTVWRVYYNMMKPYIDKYLKDIPKSPVRELLEMEPETAKFEKPERTLDGKIRVTVNVVGKGVFSGVGRNYRIAKSAAAKKALRFIRTMQQEGMM